MTKVLIFSALALAPVALRADGYPPDFGLASKVMVTGNTMTVKYFGWESTTYYGHTIWAMTAQDYQDNSSMGCFSTELAPALCDNRKGVPLFTKPKGTAAFDPTTFGPTSFSLSNYFVQQTEIILVIQVNQGDMNNWFFSGDPSRNSDGKAHLASFDANGVPIHPGEESRVPGTTGTTLYGFEDVYYNSSDWDFNNALFSLSFEDIPGDPNSEVPTPEPGTMILLGTGLAGLAGYRRRRRADRTSS